MYEGFVDFKLDVPIEDATFLDLCKAAPTQRSLKEMKEASLELLKQNTGNDELAEMAYNAMRNCKEGYMKIRRQWPSLGEPHEGWTYIFAAGLPLFLDRPDEWYHTSNIEKIDWEGRTFVTRNSVYTFEFINEESL